MLYLSQETKTTITLEGENKMKVTVIVETIEKIGKNLELAEATATTKTIGETIHFQVAGYNFTGIVEGVKEDQSAFIVRGRKDAGGKERTYFVRPVNMI